MFERSLQILLHEIVDYAGLFPPAALELDPAVRNYARYLGEPDEWMLGRFVCPASRLAALPAYAELFARARLRLTVLTRGGETEAVHLSNLATDAADLSGLGSALGERVAIDAIESRLPSSLVDQPSADTVAGFVARHADALRAFDGRVRPVFFEIPVKRWPEAKSWAEMLKPVVAGLQSHNESSSAGTPRCGLKIRSGGLDSAAFPSPAQLTDAILNCVRAGVPMKFTAGLHHPIRRYDPGVRAHMHGFINVFLAATLGYALQLARHDVMAVLEETDPAEFHFSSTFCGWDQADATIGEVQWARQNVALSFGSCSFDEPRDDLRALGWL